MEHIMIRDDDGKVIYTGSGEGTLVLTREGNSGCTIFCNGTKVSDLMTMLAAMDHNFGDDTIVQMMKTYQEERAAILGDYAREVKKMEQQD